MFKLLLVYFSFAQSLTVTSLNIEWFGNGDTKKSHPGDEYRSERLKQFLDAINSDVYVFQEIVEKWQLGPVLPDYKCQSYQTSFRHQHVVLCLKGGIQVTKFRVYRGVQLDRPGLRPAVSATVKWGEKSLTIWGVHLKAGPNDTQTRILQLERLFKSHEFEGRHIVIGDFNAFPKSRTGLDTGDIQLMNRIFEERGFTHSFFENSYLGRKERPFDQAWTKNVSVDFTRVYGPCKDTKSLHPFDKYAFYKRFVSDHCAIQVEIQPPQTRYGTP